MQLTVEQNKQPTIVNLQAIPQQTVLYRVVMQNPSREAFLSDYGKLITQENLKINFSLIQILFVKEDFHLANLTKETISKNMQVKNCLEFKCPISFDKFLQKGFSLEDFSLVAENLDYYLMAISKISFFNIDEADNNYMLKSLVAKGESVSYENDLKAFLKYNQFLLRRNKIIKNFLGFAKEFEQIKKVNNVTFVNVNDNNTENNDNIRKIMKLSENYEVSFNYAILAYEKFLVKIKHLELIGDKVKGLVRNSLKDLKKRYIIN